MAEEFSLLSIDLPSDLQTWPLQDWKRSEIHGSVEGARLKNPTDRLQQKVQKAFQ